MTELKIPIEVKQHNSFYNVNHFIDAVFYELGELQPKKMRGGVHGGWTSWPSADSVQAIELFRERFINQPEDEWHIGSIIHRIVYENQLIMRNSPYPEALETIEPSSHEADLENALNILETQQGAVFRNPVETSRKAHNRYKLFERERSNFREFLEKNIADIYAQCFEQRHEIGGVVRIHKGKISLDYIADPRRSPTLLTEIEEMRQGRSQNPSIVMDLLESDYTPLPRMQRRILQYFHLFSALRDKGVDTVAINGKDHDIDKHFTELTTLYIPAMAREILNLLDTSYRLGETKERPAIIASFHYHPIQENFTVRKIFKGSSKKDLIVTTRGPEIIFEPHNKGLDVYILEVGQTTQKLSYNLEHLSKSTMN